MSHLITCSECTKQLQVPDDLIGKKVQCPECKNTFIAEVTETEVITSSPKNSNLPVPTRKGASWDTNKGSVDEEEDDYDRKKNRRRDEDDDDFDRRPSRRQRRRRSSYRSNLTPHRGGMILAFGIIGLVTGLGFIFGPIAWIMANGDMREISEGRMDPEGEGMTQTGRILGIIATILSIVGLLIPLGFFGCFCCAGFFGAMADANQRQNRRRF